MDQRVASQSSDRTLRILLLEDSALDAELVTEALAVDQLDMTVEHVVSASQFRQAIQDTAWDVVLADYILPGFDGLSALEIARECCPGTPFIFVSGALGEEVAVEALKRGATDYVLKERLDRLPSTVLRAIAEAHEREEKRRAQDALHRLLDERTALLHELDHRVKNNLQLLLSLIGIEIRQTEEGNARTVLERMRERLRALAAAHLDLYDGQGAARFNVGQFARGLCEELTANLGTMAVRTEFDVEDVEVGAAKAAPIALLFNEIVVNALSHAYGERHGTLRLRMAAADGLLRFELSDEAFSLEEKRAAQDSSSGTILKALARQLDAVVEWPQDEPAILVRVEMPF